ncbi:MAG: hypothetical protein AABW63_03405 [Nanoarchaeota archaeon]
MVENTPIRQDVYDMTLYHDDLSMVSLGRSNTPFVYDMVVGAAKLHSQESKIVEVKDVLGPLRPSDPSTVRIIQDIDGLTQVILDAGKMGTSSTSVKLNLPIENILDGLALNLSSF